MIGFKVFLPDQLPIELQWLLAFLFGLVIGSFLNVVVVRLPRGRSLISPSSRCGRCRSPLKAWMNLPLISFLVTGGQCSFCGFPFSVRYPLVELICGLLFLAVNSLYGWTATGVVMSLFSAALLAISFIDMEFRIIPDSFSIGGWIIGLLIAALAFPGYPVTFMESLGASLTGAFFFWAISFLYRNIQGEDGLGGGDVKLLGMLGAFLGFGGVLNAVLVGSILGALAGLANIVILQRSKRYPIPFAPFLIIGAFTKLFELDLLNWWNK